MNNQPIQQKAKTICQMLFEITTGNLTFRLQRDEENTELDELSEILNTAAKKMEL